MVNIYNMWDNIFYTVISNGISRGDSAWLESGSLFGMNINFVL